MVDELLTTIPNSTKLVSVAEMQAIEREADARGHTYAEMMEIAGHAVAETITTRLGETQPRVLVLAGPGNNGGDGLVCARCLHDSGIDVRLYLWKRRTDPEHDYEQHFAKTTALGIEATSLDEDGEFAALKAWLAASDVVVDALLGTGANRPIKGELAVLLGMVRDAVAHKTIFVVAVDCASGLNCDTGAVDPHTVPADTTVTFACAKQGHYKFPGPTVTGDLIVADIGTPDDLVDDIQMFVLTEEIVGEWLPKRTDYSHKGTFGKVLLTVGSVNYPGAAYLACVAAGRVGAGLVTGAIPEPVWGPSAAKLPEATWLPLATGYGEASGAIGEAALSTLEEAVTGYDAFVLGCGLGQRATTQRLVQRLLEDNHLPATVIDADGLNCLAQKENWRQLLPPQVILTPHPAEMARLCNLAVSEVVANRWALAREQAAAWNAVVLLKGPYTVIAEPGGLLAILPVATPALATAGTGDVLAGAIGGLLAQGVSPFGAACLGAWLHGQAGKTCAAEIGPAGVLASDLPPRLPQTMVQLRNMPSSP